MKKYIISSLLLSAPAITSAQSYDVSDLSGLFAAVSDIINIFFPVLVGIAVFTVAWGIFKFIVNAGDPEERKKGVARMLWGVIGVFLILSVWGLVNILVNTFKLDNTPINPPILLQ